MLNVFIKGKISNRDFLVDLLFRHLLAKVKSIPFNTSIVKYKTSIFHRKDLRVLVQIPHPRAWRTVKFPWVTWGGMLKFELIGNYFHFFISIRLHCERASRALRAPLSELNMFLHPVGKRLNKLCFVDTETEWKFVAPCWPEKSMEKEKKSIYWEVWWSRSYASAMTLKCCTGKMFLVKVLFWVRTDISTLCAAFSIY